MNLSKWPTIAIFRLSNLAMKFLSCSAAFLFFILISSCTSDPAKKISPVYYKWEVPAPKFDFAKYVDPMIGTSGHGHTFPGATAPFGMVQLSPDTRADGSWDGCPGYHYSDSLIYGFSHTHLSGTGIPDYSDILFMPMIGLHSFEPKPTAPNSRGYANTFKHENESASPGYYRVKFDD